MHTLGGRLLELVRKLDALGPRPSLIDLAHAIETSQLTPADVAPFMQTNPQSYNRAPVVVREPRPRRRATIRECIPRATGGAGNPREGRFQG
jgi:hypothetical protein